MKFIADLHIHSKYSRATSRDLDLENLAFWGQKKGIQVIGAGDFTHPAWFKEIQEKLVPAEDGFFRLKPEVEKNISEKLPPPCRGFTRFLLSVEISTIYKKGDKTRKIHHLVFAPDFEKAQKIRSALEKIGNIRSDGRPILGLDSRHLLEIVLEAGVGCFLIPAHIWTPWFSVLGSKSGFDAVADCYGDLAEHIFAVETGLSSDPEMNWKVSSLDRYRLVSNSDAHSPGKLGREACSFDTDLSYFSLKRSLETGKGYLGTVEFFPEEGKYHMDGHRNCGVRFTPEESRSHAGICPKCRKPLTLGVMYRVEELADRHDRSRPESAADFQSIIPLPEIISEIKGMGVASQGVQLDFEKVVAALGSELQILNKIPLDNIQKQSSSLLSEAISRMRAGKVIREAGYDGEYGKIRLFEDDELKNLGSVGALFDFAVDTNPKSSLRAEPCPPSGRRGSKVDDSRLTPCGNDEKSSAVGNDTKKTSVAMKQGFSTAILDPDQSRALEILEGVLLIIAGPGSGKTRTLTHRVAQLIKSGKATPPSCLTITFTKRAAQEMKDRLKILVPEQWGEIPVMTFHALGYLILEENRVAAGLPRGFSIIKEGETRSIDEGRLEYEDLLRLSTGLLEEDPGLCAFYKKRFSFISVDEYQDIDALQYRLIRLLSPATPNLCVIGDPDQAIYSFRGADVNFFLKFKEDFPRAREIRLTRNYRSTGNIVSASSQLIRPASLAGDSKMEALLNDPGKITIHQARTDKAEAEFVVHTIEKLIGGTSFYSMDTARTDGFVERVFSFADFAILFRAQFLAKPLEEALERSGIPYERHSHENTETEVWDTRADRVKLLTLHAAKGLEFSVIFMVGLEEGLLPFSFGKELTEEALAEERRVFYVGMTRAGELLYLTHAAKRLRQGKVKEQAPSRFLKDIEEKLLERSATRYKKKSTQTPQLEMF